MGGSVRAWRDWPLDRRRLLIAAAASLFLPRLAAARTAVADAARVYWSAAGRGPRTLIFVHGWTCDTTSWAAQVPVFARRYRVVTLDLPGHGRSAPPTGGTWSIEGFARAVEAVRAAAGVEKAVLVGHSMGALVVRQYALMHPDRVEGLVLADGLVQGPPTGPPRPVPVLVGEEGRKAHAAMFEAMFTPRTPPAVKAAVMRTAMATPEATVAGAMAATRDTATRSAMPATGPVLGIYADHSKLADPAVRKAIFPTMEYHELPGTGHFLMLEQPEAFNALLEAFLARLG